MSEKEKVFLGELLRKQQTALDYLARRLSEFFSRYGFGANTIFVGPDHWLAKNEVSMVHGMKVVVMKGDDIEVALRLKESTNTGKGGGEDE